MSAATRRSSTWRWMQTAALLVCGPHLVAQAPSNESAGAAGQGAQSPHTITGQVVDSVTGEPIYRALVQIGAQFAALTDHEGRFQFDGVPETRVSPFAMKPGYFADKVLLSANFAPTGLVSNSDGSSSFQAPPLTVKLIPEAILSGTVSGQDGEPLEGIPVRLKALAVADGLERWTQRMQTTSNSQGQYRFAELEAGKYAVVTGFHTEGLPDAQSTVAYVPAQQPPAGTSGPVSSIALTSGAHQVVNLNPDVEKLYPVTGRVTGYGASQGVSFQVRTMGGEELSPSSHFTARTGEFQMFLPAGTFEVRAVSYQPRGPLQARMELNIPEAPVRGVSLTLEPAASIPVDLEYQPVDQAAAGGPTSGVSGAQTPPASIDIMLTNADGPDYGRVLPARSIQPHGGDSTAGASGPLVIENVTPGRYMLAHMPGSSWYVASANCGGVDLVREELAIAGSAAGCTIRVVLRNDLGVVHVTVHGTDITGQNVSFSDERFFVYLLPMDDLVRQATILPGRQNDFTGSSVAPGKYLVLAIDHQVELAYRDPEALRHLEGLGQEITVTANGESDVAVTLIRGEP